VQAVPSTVRDAAEGNTVLVQARTASGAVGVAALTLGQPGADSVRQQICNQEGDSLAASFFPVSVDAATHSFTVAVSAHSLAAQPLRYWVTASFANGPENMTVNQPSSLSVLMSGGRPDIAGLTADAVDALLAGARLQDAAPLGPVAGTLAPGGRTTAGYTVHVTACPSVVPNSTADLVLQMFLDDHGQPAYFQTDSFDLVTLVAAACGLVA
jgi:hypothetical protein